MVSYIGGVGPVILKSTWIQISIGIITVTLRAITAGKTGDKWRWDFLWILLALILGVTSGITNTIAVTHGLGNHLDKLTLEQIYKQLYWIYPSLYTGVACIACSKFSVTALLLKVEYRSANKLRRYILWISAVLFGITSLFEIFFTTFQCMPETDKVYLVLDVAACRYVKAAQIVSYIHAITSGVTDIFLALFPITFVYNLQTSWRVKTGLCVLMGVGIVPGAFAFYRIKTLHGIYVSKDFSCKYFQLSHTNVSSNANAKADDTGIFMIGAGIELGSLIILCSIPPLRPLFKKGIDHVTTRVKTIRGTRNDSTTNRGTNISSKFDGGRSQMNIVVVEAQAPIKE